MRIIIINSIIDIMKFDRNKLFKLKAALLKLSEAQTEEGVTLITDGDLEVGVEVFVDGEDGLTPAGDKAYHYDGKVITVEGGVVTAIAEAQTEEPEPQPETDPEPETDPQPETDPETDPEPEPEPAEDVEALKTRIAELEALVEELKKKLEEPVAESVEEEMKKQEKNVSKNNMNYARLREAIREVSQKRK